MYSTLYEFTPAGLAIFQKAFMGEIDEDAINLLDPSTVQKLDGTGSIETMPFETAKEMAVAVMSAVGSRELSDLIPRNALWAWLTFVLRDVLFPKDGAGRRKVGELHRWYPSDANDWQKGQRHLVRMPVQLHSSLGNNADHLLCVPPSVLPDIREQLTSQQDMFHPTFQAVARLLYFDERKNKLKVGSGGKGGGSPRRLAKIRQQLVVTWNLFDLPPETLIEMLPKEFNRFKPSVA